MSANLKFPRSTNIAHLAAINSGSIVGTVSTGDTPYYGELEKRIEALEKTREVVLTSEDFMRLCQGKIIVQNGCEVRLQTQVTDNLLCYAEKALRPKDDLDNLPIEDTKEYK